MPPDDDDLLLRRRLLDRRRNRAGPDHLLGGGGRLMRVHDQADEPRLIRLYPLGYFAGTELLCLGVEDADAVAAVTHIAGDQAAPQGRLYRGQLVAEVLIDAPAFAGIDKQ